MLHIFSVEQTSNKFKECLEKQYSEILRIEALEQEKKRKEEQEKREYSEYLRLKKKYEG